MYPPLSPSLRSDLQREHHAELDRRARHRSRWALHLSRAEAFASRAGPRRRSEPAARQPERVADPSAAGVG
ncbi:MAG TPA: hypothetical protein VGH10_01650 [Actinomycetota bacterium]|jgi:hypothetical protein